MKTQNALIILIISLFIISCNQPTSNKATNTPEITDEVLTKLESEIYQEEGNMDTQKAVKLLKAYETQIKNNKEKEFQSKYIFNAANLAMNLNKPQTALRYFEQYLSAYPNDKKAEQALFLKAFLLDNSIKNLDAAKAAYQEFIRKYPESDFADDAEASLKYLGKSPEELIKEFEANNK